MIRGEENKQYCTNCKKGPLKSYQYNLDFFNMPQCSDSCERAYRERRDREYDDYVDPLRMYRNIGEHD